MDWTYSELGDWLATTRGPAISLTYDVLDERWSATFNFVTAASFAITSVAVTVKVFSDSAFANSVGDIGPLTGTTVDQILEDVKDSLQSATTYYYYVDVTPTGGPSSGTTKRIPHPYGSYSSITTPPLPSGNGRLVCFTDDHTFEGTLCGVDTTKARPYWHERMCKEIVDIRPHAVLNGGDWAFTESVTLAATLRASHYAAYRNGPMSIVYSNAATYQELGNHETEAGFHSNAANCLAIRKEFIPNPSTDDANERYFSFAVGGIKVIVLDPYTNTLTGGGNAYPAYVTDWQFGTTQKTWFRGELAEGGWAHVLVFIHNGSGAYTGDPGIAQAAYGWGNGKDVSFNLAGTDMLEIVDACLFYGITAMCFGHSHTGALAYFRGMALINMPSTWRILTTPAAGMSASYGNLMNNGGISDVAMFKQMGGYVRFDQDGPALRVRWVRSNPRWNSNDTIAWANTDDPKNPLPLHNSAYWGERTAVQSSGGTYFVTVPSTARAILGIYRASEVEAFTAYDDDPTEDLQVFPVSSNVYDRDFSSSQTVNLTGDPGEDYVYVDYVPVVRHDITLHRQPGAPSPTLSYAAR